jgi:hypothetical protein
VGAGVAVAIAETVGLELGAGVAAVQVKTTRPASTVKSVANVPDARATI